jgi:cysteine synthase B
MRLVMPESATMERRAAMAAYGAEVVLVRDGGGMEQAIDLARAMAERGEGKCLDQFSNADNWRAHYASTGPEIWDGTGGRVTAFVSAMGTTGTIMGVSRYMREAHPEAAVRIVGVRPEEGSKIPGIRRWPVEYLPKIYDAALVDDEVEVSQREAEDMARRLAAEEGIFAGVSSGGAVAAALKHAEKLGENAVIVCIICDRGDRYLSTTYPAPI